MISLRDMVDKTIQENVSLPEYLYNIVARRAKSHRISISDYISQVIASSIEEEYVEIADEKTEKAIGEAMDDIEHGRYVRVKPGDRKTLHKVLWGE